VPVEREELVPVSADRRREGCLTTAARPGPPVSLSDAHGTRVSVTGPRNATPPTGQFWRAATAAATCASALAGWPPVVNKAAGRPA